MIEYKNQFLYSAGLFV